MSATLTRDMKGIGSRTLRISSWEGAEWQRRMMRQAIEVASWSKDPVHKVGCIIASEDFRQNSWGYNGFPRGVDDTSKRLEDPDTRRALTVHAEMNAILNSAVPIRGWQLYVTKAPCFCHGCAHAIIQAGIAWVVAPALEDNSRWSDDQRLARNLLQEAGVHQVVLMDGLEEVQQCYRL